MQTVENGVLTYSEKPDPKADATMTLSKATLDRVPMGEITLDQAITAGDVKIDGRKEAVGEFLGMLDT